MTNPNTDGLDQGQLSTSAGGTHNVVSPTAEWVRAVATVAAKIKQAELESKRPLPEDFSASDVDIIRARALSSQI